MSYHVCNKNRMDNKHTTWRRVIGPLQSHQMSVFPVQLAEMTKASPKLFWSYLVRLRKSSSHFTQGPFHLAFFTYRSYRQCCVNVQAEIK